MKKNDVKIGQVYLAKVTNQVVPVRIDATNPVNGWAATNVVTGRKVRIKSAQRLQRPCTQADLAGLERPAPRRRKKPVGDATQAPTAATGAKIPTKATKEAKPAKGHDTGSQDATRGNLAAQSPKKAGSKRISGLTAAFMVLVDADAELDTKAIVQIAAEKGWWKSDAATPAATIYSAILREVAAKGNDSRFERGKRRGTFRARCTPQQTEELTSEKQ